MLSLPPPIEGARSVLIMGCGGGFDVFAGVPLAVALRKAGKRIVFANHTSTGVAAAGADRIAAGVWRVTPESAELPSFREKWLSEWLLKQSWDAPVHALAHAGAVPLRAAIGALAGHEAVDALVLVDGGADSILFGDEPGLGTAVEDALALVAANGVVAPTLVASIGFGVDDHDGVSHYSFLENVATLSRDGAFLGAQSVTQGSDEAGAFLDLVAYANARQPQHQSIVCNSIASAIRGEFGDYRATARATSPVFISALTSQYWLFDLAAVVARMHYAIALTATNTPRDARATIELARHALPLRSRRAIPL